MQTTFQLPKTPYSGNGIAKRIHLTYPTREGLPEPLKNNVEAIRQQNPDFELCFYSDQDVQRFIANEFGSDVLSLYERLNPKYGAARADLFRYLCVYRLGGVYLDIKAKTTRPLSEVLREDDQYILAQWDPEIDEGRFAEWGLQKGLEMVAGGEYQQWHVIAAAGHPFLHAVIEQVLRNIQNYSPLRLGSGRQAVIRTTGPITYTQTIFPLLSQFAHRIVRIERDFGIYYSIYTAAEGSKHTVHFANHYSRLTEPLVNNNLAASQLYNTYQFARRVAKQLRDTVLRKQPAT